MIVFDKDKRSYDELTAKNQGVEIVATVDSDTWSRLSVTGMWDIDIENKKFIDITNSPGGLMATAVEAAKDLVEFNYNKKAETAYTAVTCTLNGQKLAFQTNAVSMTNMLSTKGDFDDDSELISVSWKFWSVELVPNRPINAALTRDNFYELFKFVKAVGKLAFAVEEKYNDLIKETNPMNLINAAWVEDIKTAMSNEYKAIDLESGLEIC